MAKVGRNKPELPATVPTDRLVISLRSYVVPPKKSKFPKRNKISKDENSISSRRRHASDWVLIFDCETFITPDQSLRFGNFQLRLKGQLIERGVFYQPGSITDPELVTIKKTLTQEEKRDPGPPYQILTRQEFVENVLFEKSRQLGAQIVGFNLPFDISRLAVRHAPARGRMKGGISFTLIDNKKWPTITVKHISQRMSFMHFTGTRPKQGRQSQNDTSEITDPDITDVDRGFFVDVKTLAGALLSENHSLASLSELLQIPHPKKESDDHGNTINPEYVRYALRDVQATWECFETLNRQLSGLRLDDTGPYNLYSEASLGKAYLKTMGIKPWCEMQPDFDPAGIGRILSTYYGGRSEVHIRRTIVPVIHCDFLSMYPTVCTLMGLWKFVIAKGVSEIDDTNAIRAFVANATAAHLQAPDVWKHLAAVVQVIPDGDLFPVRAHYGKEDQATIGLNYLTGDDPMWFTLADVLVSQILTGKVPSIIRAIRFVPDPVQADLKPVTIAGQVIDPAAGDFYKSLIMHRLHIGDQAETASENDRPRLESLRQAIKILANSTSYGIFVELNVNERKKAAKLDAFGVRDGKKGVSTHKVEEPGRYFHPLLGTLITGAARLMLALAERQVIDQGLNWAFCDTDSMAIANVNGLSAAEFQDRALKVQRSFSSLNPYGRIDSILQLEKVNFPLGSKRVLDCLDPPNCLAVSAKRYVLFNRDGDKRAIIRKASGHGLGYLLDPYDEPAEERRKKIKQIGVPTWQEDVWKAIIAAADAEKPDEVQYRKIKGFNGPAASRYAATSLELLDWFDGYNGIGKRLARKPYSQQVKPFNFLLSLQAKSRIDMAAADPAVLKSSPLWRRREPSPAAPYRKKVKDAVREVFDRATPELTHIPISWLKTYARSLVRYHMHREAKFLGSNFDECGVLRRRHVQVLAFQPIGKEADNLEEREYLGEGDDAVEYDFARDDYVKMRAAILEDQKRFGISDRDVCDKAKISHHTMAQLRRRKKLPSKALMAIAEAIEFLTAKRAANDAEQEEGYALLLRKRVELGSDVALARFLNKERSYISKLLVGERRLSIELLARLRGR